ncbi:MAG: hypothetical protein E5V77_01120, partial [Mesorhizobium sp.]
MGDLMSPHRILSLVTLTVLLMGGIGSAWAQEDETDQDERMPVQASPMKLPISASQAVQNKILIPEATMVKTRRLQLPQDISIDTFNNCP